MREVIEKYFKDDRTKYFHPADLIAADHYIKYEYNGNRVILHIGCNDGEIPVFVCYTPEALEEKLKAILY